MHHDQNQNEFDRFMEAALGLTQPIGKAVTSPIYGTADNPIPIPEQLLREVTRDHPGIWKKADEIRESRITHGEKCPEHTFIPTMGWVEVLDALHPHLPRTPEVSGRVIQESFVLDFIGSWRLTKKIYRFPPSLRDALMATPLSGEIPCETLKRLPEWGMFIETPGLIDESGRTWDGLGVSVAVGDTNESSLNILLVRRESNHVLTFEGTPIQLVEGETLEAVLRDCYANAVENAEYFKWRARANDENSIATFVRFVARCVSLVLYLCSEEPELADGWKPSKPVGKRVKQGTRHFPADKSTTWDVGVRLGAALDMAAKTANQEDCEWKGGTHARPRGHIRRAHWHTYRTGTMRSIPVVKWISPILVNLGKHQPFPVTVCPVV